MSIIWMENFNFIAPGTTPASSPTIDTLVQEKYPITNLVNSDADILSTPGPGNTLKFGDATNEIVYIALPSTHPRGQIMYGAMKVRIYQSASSSPFLAFYTTTGNDSLAIYIDSKGTWRVNRLGSGQVKMFNVLNWNWGEYTLLEWKFVNGNASDTPNNGEIVLKVNGVEYVNETPIDTYNFGSGINQIRIRNLSSGGDRGYELRDIIICNTSGSICNTWIGPTPQVHGLLPNADGTTSQWTRSSGAVDYSLIDEVSRDSTDYIESSTSTEKTTVNFGATGSEANIKGVAIATNSLLTAAGSETMQHVVRHSTSEANSGNLTVDSTSEKVQVSFHENNPSTSAQWTAAELDAIEAGVEYQ